MKRFIRSPKTLSVQLMIWLVLLYLPGLKLIELYTANGGIPVSLCYLFSVSFLPFLVLQFPKLRISPWYITGLYLFVIIWAVIRFPAYGFSKGILHWVFGAFLLLVLVNCGAYLTSKDLMRVLGTGYICFVALHLLFNVVNWQSIVQVVVGGESAASLPSLTRGGRNLDATWLALGCFLVSNKKLRIGCLLYSFAYAIIGVSRVGLIASGLCLFWILIYDEQYGFRKRTAWVWIGIAMVGLGVTLYLGLAQRMFNRLFLGRGEGAVSFLSGRENMWSNVWPMFKTNPLGVGAGNAMPVMRAGFGFTGYEDVMHNVFFQWLIDEGVLGGLWYLLLAFLLIRSQRHKETGWFRAPLAAYFLTYFVLSLVQFHGGEALMIFTLGCFLLEQTQWAELRMPGREKSAVKEAVDAE